jgi:hypothetical protein
MRTFIKRVLYFFLIGLIGISIPLASYIYMDPFKVLYEYKDYSYPDVIPNRDYISTEMFNKNFHKYRYNSFIFGSSRTLAFKPESWKKFLKKSDSPFMFDASAESIYGIYKKIKYLDSLKVQINNALIILCRDASFINSGNQEGHLFVKHPATSGGSKLNFHKIFLNAYLDPHFLYNFYVFKFSHKYKTTMKGYIEFRKITYDTITNKICIIDQEKELALSPAQYYNKRANIFYPRIKERNDSIQRITLKQVFMLKEIIRIFKKNNTNYKVILSPLYEQIKFNKADFTILKDVFGEYLYDFTGNNRFTESKTNYYESSHYNTEVGDSILSIIYKGLP